MKKLTKYQSHFLALILFVFAIAFLPSLVDRFVFSYGRPIEMRFSELKNTDEIRYGINRLDPIKKVEQNIDYLWGWSFVPADENQENYKVFIGLVSENRKYLYQTEVLQRPNLNQAFPEVDFDLTNSGFIAYITKEFIKPDTYDVWIIFENIESGAVISQLTKNVIVRTPNTIAMSTK